VAETFAEIPDRDHFKASEVCEIAKVQSYVLRSWEQEFPNLGVARSAGGQRVYRRADVERVLRIKQLVFGEGLTLAGVRRRLDGTEPAAGAVDLLDDDPVALNEEARVRLSTIRRDLRSLLDMLDGRSGGASGRTDEVNPMQPELPEMEGGAGESRVAAWPSLSKPKPGKRKRSGARGGSDASE
jgi:DNA-binding transcriptional MerR regulator